ncbi:MAG: NnrS family protein [Corticimicrobacter sp.]|uniref:NnrS family protein n=1 Tax=Corticimicrobacter sp. TaxID=2678536 RepID=UPI0032DA76BB
MMGFLSGRWHALLAHPLMLCGVRPFFLLAAGSAVLLMAPWLLFSAGQPAVVHWLAGMPGGAVAWHAHELLYGYGLAAVAGFLMAAAPEFTQTAAPSRAHIAATCLCWLAARLAWLLAPALPQGLAIALAVLGNGAVTVLLLCLVAPRVWVATGRPHLAFLYALLVLGVLQAGFFAALLLQADPLRWLYAAVGGLMVLVIVAASRISMRIVNSRIVAGVMHDPLPDTPVYLARPPRRNFAIFAIVLCSVLEFSGAPAGVIGWSALAACAAVFGLLNDWHIGRPLFNRWALMLYACYWMLALGYGLMGLSWLQAPWALSPGRHLLMIGAMGLSIFAVMCIAGRQHCGHWLDVRAWVPLSALALGVAACLRALAGLPLGTAWYPWLLALAGVLWMLAFGAYFARMWPILARPRTDGQTGCAEPADAHTHGHGGGCG